MGDSSPNMADSSLEDWDWALICVPGNRYINLFMDFSVLATVIVLWLLGG